MKKIIWPEGKKFAVCLTHDVDRIRMTYQFISRVIREKRLYHLTSIFSKSNPYWNFNRIMRIEEKYKVYSTFFFLNESKKFQIFKPSNYALSLGYYDIHEPKVINIIKKLNSSGWEIGLHGSYDSHNNLKLLSKEKIELEKIVNKKIIGIRQHFLNLDIPNTWKLHYKIGLRYDTSFGIKNNIGYRDNKIIPFKPLNNSFLVIPLTIMDTILFKISKNFKDAWQKCYNLIKYSEKKGSVITILWHNATFNEKSYPEHIKIYEKIIKECLKRDAWITTGSNICKFLDNKL